MSTDKLLSTAQKHLASVEALAALAAKLRAETEGLVLEPAVAQIIDDIVVGMGLRDDDLAATTPAQRQALIGMVRSFLRQAADLMDQPTRPSGWTYEDPVVLQSQGRASMALVQIIKQTAAGLGDLSARLEEPGGAFLDVGTGVGWLAVAMAEAFPNLHIVGIDVWKPALALAARNVAAFPDRIALRQLDVTQLDDQAAFDAVFLPGPFLPKEIVPRALERARQALRPGGWLLFGVYTPAEDPLTASLADLRVVRSGGHPWRNSEIVQLLEGAGFQRARALARTWAMPLTFVVASR